MYCMIRKRNVCRKREVCAFGGKEKRARPQGCSAPAAGTGGAADALCTENPARRERSGVGWRPFCKKAWRKILQMRGGGKRLGGMIAPHGGHKSVDTASAAPPVPAADAAGCCKRRAGALPRADGFGNRSALLYGGGKAQAQRCGGCKGIYPRGRKGAAAQGG